MVKIVTKRRVKVSSEKKAMRLTVNGNSKPSVPGPVLVAVVAL